MTKLELLEIEFVAMTIKELLNNANCGILEPDYAKRDAEVGCNLLLKLIAEAKK